MVVQHDQVFVRNVDIAGAIESMTTHSTINYIGMLSCSDIDEVSHKLIQQEYNVFYEDIQVEINSDMKHEYYKYRQIINATNSHMFIDHKFVFDLDKSSNKQLVTNIIQSYTKIKYGVPLMYLTFWYDKTHICRTDFYRKNIFDTIHIDYSTGNSQRVKNFIEDSVGKIFQSNIKRHGLAAFKNHSMYILHDDSTVAIRHSNGRAYLTTCDKVKLI
jgi:hypothetical protein